MWRTFKRLKLYILAIPAFCFVLGAGLNVAVKIANNDKFPVMINAEKSKDETHPRGYAAGEMMDEKHVVMSSNDRLKFLADVIDIGGIYSIGDGLVNIGQYGWTFAPFIWIYALCCKVQEDAKYYEG